MAVSDGFRVFIAEQLSPLGPVAIRRMFGGAGVFAGERMFGILDDDGLYLKADATTIPNFQAEGMLAFTYQAKTGPITMDGYWRCPERLLDEPDELLVWARAAIAVAERATTGKTPKVGKPTAKAKSAPRRKPV